MKKLYLSLVLTTLAGYAQNVSPTINGTPSRQFGQLLLESPITSIAPNLVEGREMNQPASIAFDKSANPPILYIVDSGNNRVLGYKNPNSRTPCGMNNPACGFADLVIGQRTKNATLPGGPNPPTGSLTSGFNLPESVAVDAAGNLYVLDVGNNRILRFPSPFNQTSNPLTVDLVIGQKTLTSGSQPNTGLSNPADNTVAFGSLSAMAFDPSGNLWVTDTLNNRVLRFPASALTAGSIMPHADVVLGQNSFTTNTVTNLSNPPQLANNIVNQPRGIAIDSTGDIYVGDGYGRVLFFGPPNGAIGNLAQRILGLCVTTTALNCANPLINNYTLINPAGLFTDGTHLFVADANNSPSNPNLITNRIVEYDVPANWPAGPPPNQTPVTVQYSPPMMAVIGQSDFNSGKKNRGLTEPDATSFNAPLGGAFNGTDLWVVDLGNNRVLGMPQAGGAYKAATWLLGQVDFPFSQPNLIEGRELFILLGNTPGGDVAVDRSANASAPHLYIADTFNNRVLGFKDARNIGPGQPADLVIGQSDRPGQPGSRFYRALFNDPQNDPQIPTQTGLSQPSGVVVDANGDLYVADTGNGRILRFPGSALEQEFKNKSGTPQLPNLVLGQAGFGSSSFDASQNTMASPYGLALLSSGSLLVSDATQNRIMVFKRPSGGDFHTGDNAAAVIGQQSFTTTLAGNSTAALNSPRHISVDSDDLVYVADAGNNRLLVFPNPLSSSNGAPSNFQLNNLSQPQGVAVNQSTGEIWLSMSNNLVWRLPILSTLQLQSNPNAPPYTQQLQPQTTPFSIGLDKSNNPIMAEASNRATFFYPKLTYQHAASFNGGDGSGNYFTPLAPGQLALLYRVGQGFSPLDTFAVQTNPWPLLANDYQITVDGVAAPIFAIVPSAGYIAFQVPSATPSSGNADFLVTHPSTGEIVGSGQIPMAQYNPGFFTASANGIGQVAAFNDDNTVNGASNPIPRDGNHVISFCLTGGGVFDGGGGPPPADGFAPPNVANTHDVPILLNGSFPPNGIMPASALQYSGAGCDFAGGWQVSVKVPSDIPPSPATAIAIQINGFNSAVGPKGQSTAHVTFWTK